MLVVAVVPVAFVEARGRFNGDALLVGVGRSWARLGVIGAGEVCWWLGGRDEGGEVRLDKGLG